MVNQTKTEMAGLTETACFPCRLAPDDWKTAFVAGSTLLGPERELVFAAMAGEATPAYEMFVLDKDRAHWRSGEATDTVAAVLWLATSRDWLVRYEIDDDACLCARREAGCLPSVDDWYWLSAGGVLTTSGFEPSELTVRSGRMKEHYDHSALRLCAEADLMRALGAASTAALRSELGTNECRLVGRLLHRMRPVPLPTRAVNVVLTFVEDLAFWPGGEERTLWSDTVLRDVDARRAGVLVRREVEVRQALVALVEVASQEPG